MDFSQLSHTHISNFWEGALVRLPLTKQKPHENLAVASVAAPHVPRQRVSLESLTNLGGSTCDDTPHCKSLTRPAALQ